MSNKLEYLDKNGLKKVLGLIKNNASAVWKGTKAEWDVLPAAEKQTYDLAMLLDTTLVKAVDREDGTETDVANLNKIVHLTKAEYDAMPSHDPDTYYMITDDTTVMSPGYPHPDWANAVAITAAQLQAGYTVPSDGMIVGIAWVTDEKPVAEIQVNGVTVAIAKTSNIAQIQCPVEQGNTLSTSNKLAGSNLRFVPWK